MLNTGILVEQLGIIAIFLEGLLSFLSPCVLPLVPIYLGYLSANHKNRSKTIWFTIWFIIGILTALLLLNASMGLISSFLKDHKAYMLLISGIVIVFMGLLQLGFIQIPALSRTYRIPNILQKGMSVASAFAMGFCFSFAWTPCIGPALASILLLASSGNSFLMSNVYMLVYAAGLCIPFIVVACFSDVLLKKLQGKGKWMNIALKLGAIILLCFGGYMIYQGFDELQPPKIANESQVQEETAELSEEEKMQQLIDQLYQYEVMDLYGNKVSLNDLRGKYVFLNYWATWCPPCKSEMPELQALYDKYRNSDVAIITISMPDEKQTITDIQQYIKEEGYDMPVWIDDGFFSMQFGITSLPTSYVIQKDGRPYGYVSGALNLEMMENMIQQVKNASDNES